MNSCAMAASRLSPGREPVPWTLDGTAGRGASVGAVRGDLDPRLQVAREDVVVVVHGAERAAPAGHGAQLHGVALDLRGGHERDDLVEPVAERRRAADAATAGVEVAQHVTLVAVGH